MKKMNRLIVFIVVLVMVLGNCLMSVSAKALFVDSDGDGELDEVVYGNFDDTSTLNYYNMVANDGDDPIPDPVPTPDPTPDPIPDPVPVPVVHQKLPTPNAVFDAGTMLLSNLDGTMSYSYFSGKTGWTDVPDGTSAIVVSDEDAEYALAHGISVIRFGDGITTDDSDFQIIEVHKVPTPNGVRGINPTNGNNGQIVNVAPGMQYAAGNSNNWINITSNVIGGLSAGNYRVRTMGGGTAIDSDPVTITLVYTPPTPPVPPTPVKTKEATPSADFNAMIGVLSGTQGNSYSIDGGNSWTYVGNANTVSLDMSRLSTDRGILLFRPGNGQTTTDSDRQTIQLRKAYVPTGISAISATSTAPGVISGVSSAMEYMKQGDSSWTKVTGNTISAMPGNYCVRVSGAYTTLPSDAVAVTITQSVTSAPVVVAKPTVITSQAASKTGTKGTTGITGKKLVIMQVQTALNALGYKSGTPDGVIGKGTKAAIKSYQRDKGLKETGTINTQLIKSLHIQ